MRAPTTRNGQKIGLSVRELEWAAQNLVRDFPADQQKLAKAVADMIITLISKNNAALGRLGAGAEGREEEGQR